MGNHCLCDINVIPIYLEMVEKQRLAESSLTLVGTTVTVNYCGRILTMAVTLLQISHGMKK